MAFLLGGLLALCYGLIRRPRMDVNLDLRAGTQEDGERGISHPDFRGDWQLDLQASESLAPLLRAVGKSEWKIALASRVPATHIIRCDHRRLTMLIKTPVLNQEQEMLLDGTPTRATDPEGGETLASTRWSEDGQSLITTTQASIRQPVRFRITRSLAADRRSMLLDLECPGKDGQPIRVRRVFRLLALPPAGVKASTL